MALWDQTGNLKQEPGRENGTEESENRTGATQESAGRIPEGFTGGVEYTAEDINRALTAGSPIEGLAIVPEQDTTGHGTQVLGIAAGNGLSSGGRYRGVAPKSDLIVVKLGAARIDGFPRTTELMQALEYVMRKAESMGKPVAVNLSFGNVYGSHEPCDEGKNFFFTNSKSI